MQNSLENYRTRNPQTFCPVLERENVSRGLEIFGPVYLFSAPLPSPSSSWLQISAKSHLLSALDGDEGVGMSRYLILLFTCIINFYYDYPSKSYQSRFQATCCSETIAFILSRFICGGRQMLYWNDRYWFGQSNNNYLIALPTEYHLFGRHFVLSRHCKSSCHQD